MSDLRDRIEKRFGFEPSFQAMDDGGEGGVALVGRFVVYDAEMQPVCRCDTSEVAELMSDLLNIATT